MRPLSAALVHGGIATWNVEYRRVGNAGGGWPGTYQDLAKAADLLRELAPDRLDITKVVAVGHSSGGQLALWLAARSKLPKDSPLYIDSSLPLIGAVDIDGPPDLAAFKAFDQEVCDGPVIQRFLGGSPEQFPSRYREGSATGLLPIGVRQEILYSTKMEFISSHEQDWAELFKSYAALAATAGDSVHVSALQNAGHFDGINPHSAPGKIVLSLVESVLSK
jgi:acetyl esterase/lipase